MIEACQNVKVYVDNVLANVEIINCKKAEVHVSESLRQLSVERSEGIQLHLQEAGKNCKVHSTCSSSVVVHYPPKDATEDDDWFEIAVPETVIATIKGDRLHTTCLEGLGD